MKKISRLISIPFLLMLASPVLAFEMTQPQDLDPGGQVVIGASPQATSDWPATMIFRSGVGGCTSTIVGPKTLVTAAHCVKDGESGSLKLNGTTITVNCTHHPAYTQQNNTADFALCSSDVEMSGVLFENISTSLAYPRKGQKLTLLGYGCRKEGGTDHAFGQLYAGEAVVIRTPAPPNLDIVTQGGAALCFGDSGGAPYIRTGGRRYIAGINSRGDISEFSFLSSTSTQLFVDWAVQWTESKQTTICGLSINAPGCR